MKTQPITPAGLAATLLIGSLGLLVLGLEPVLLGALVLEGRITEHVVGALVTVELVTIALGSVLGMTLLARYPAPAIGTAAGVMLAIVNMVAIGRTGAPVILVLRGVSGLAEGILMSLALVAIARDALPERASGLFLAAQTLLQLVAVYATPGMVLWESRANVCLALVAGSGLAAAGLALLAPRRLVPPEKVAGGGGLGLRSHMALIASGAFMGAVLSIWGYLGLWIARRGLGPAIESSAVALSLGAQILGALVAARMAERLPPRLVILAASAAEIVVILVMATGTASILLVHVLSACFGFLWLFSLPAFTGLLVRVDPSRRAVLYIAAAQLGGAATLPLFAGTAVAYRGLNGAFALAIAVLALTMALVVGLRGRSPADAVVASDLRG